jgi:MoxR-like ATPase
VGGGVTLVTVTSSGELEEKRATAAAVPAPSSSTASIETSTGVDAARWSQARTRSSTADSRPSLAGEGDTSEDTVREAQATGEAPCRADHDWDRVETGRRGIRRGGGWRVPAGTGVDVEDPKLIAERILANVERVIIGKQHEAQLALITLLCRGHLLIEDVPGVGKTMLARALATSTGCSFQRIQFTPDLLPTDVTGVSVYSPATGTFEFRPGPIMAQIVLTDEINRATPKTQSALLEAMEERQVTVDGVTHPLPQPFMVMATQNPIEYEGTFPLPEAQLDRFLMRIHLGYPSPTDEVLIMDAQQRAHPIETLAQVTNAAEVTELQHAIGEVYVDPLIKQYVVSLANATREHEAVYLGASPRGSLALMRATQAYAMLNGRDFVQPDDVKLLAYATLGHRVIVSPSARVRNITAAEIVDDCIQRTPVPGVRARGGV